MSNRHKNQQTVLEVLILGIFKGLWFLIKLPFQGFKTGRKRGGLSVEDRNYIATERIEIEKMLERENEVELKHAVMEADKLVDYALKQKGYSGESFADRLRSAKDSMPYHIYDQVWKGHIIRNKLAHEQGFKLSNDEYRRAAKDLLNYIKAY